MHIINFVSLSKLPIIIILHISSIWIGNCFIKYPSRFKKCVYIVHTKHYIVYCVFREGEINHQRKIFQR
ncbi:hypothetical protein RclHR1_04480017 [Rhizophagus clarus]|uniref:Uncharacterized protein n=1 Tax=Rhizophagus clarus TaxID=94130 RepID=A0A2Z6RML6_9GLOM|nr:hypothetical protein RclHR1_04480017 [Rhizophagus clarus]